MSLLNKGLNFIPTARDLSHKELVKVFNTFIANLRRSNLAPPAQIITTNKLPIFTPQKCTTNPTSYERKALTNVKNNKNIVINFGDQGSSIVIHNRRDYVKNNEDHLQDPLIYVQLEGDPTGHLTKQISSLLNQFKSEGFLTEMYRFCLPPKNVQRFYSLLKIL